jgi:hypothetical protein
MEAGDRDDLGTFGRRAPPLLAHLRRLEPLAFPITLSSAIMVARLP